MYSIASLRCTLRSGVCVSSAHSIGIHSRWNSSLATQSTDLKTSPSVETVSIPKRINRSSTDVLEALRLTVFNRHGNPHYKFHDDPFLIPQSNLAKRAFALSKESGRKSAKWIRDNYPAAFVFNKAEPHIERFTPTFKIEKEDATEDLLKQYIYVADVANANTVYDILCSEGKEIGDRTKQSYLELLCFYNSKDNPDDELLEEMWHKHAASKENRNVWLDAGRAEKLFNELEVKDAKAYTAILCGTSKYFKGDKAFDYYIKMKEQNVPISRYVYNQLIRSSSYVRETSDARWQLVEELVKSMVNDGIAPNLDTMNAILDSIVKLGAWKHAKKLALQTMSEMKYLGIEPSLGSFNSLLQIFCRDKGPVSTIIYDIMDYLAGKELEIRDLKDVNFFTTAMELCHNHVNDYQLAYEVDKLLNYKDNYKLIGNSMKESIYYQHFFKLICEQETIQNIFEIYHKLVPHTYTPEASVMTQLIKTVALFGAYEHVPTIWSDVILFEHVNRGDILNELLDVMVKNKPTDSLVCQQWSDIAWDIKTRVDNERTRRSVAVQWTGNMIGNLLMIFLNCNDYDKACEIMKKCAAEQLSISGLPSHEQLLSFGNAAFENKDSQNGLLCCQFMVDAGYLEGSRLAKRILENVNMDEKTRVKLEEISQVQPESEK